jgi:transposase
MIRSTKTSLKFSNKCKLSDLHLLIDEYRRVLSCFVDLLWDEDKIPTLLPKSITGQVDTWLSARMIQCVGKQASGVVRGVQKKQKNRKYMIDKFTKEGNTKDAAKLQKIYDEATITKPNVNEIEMELDSRFVKVDLENETCFDGWITLTSVGNKMRILLPFKKTRHFNKMLDKGKMKSGVRLSKRQITLMFDVEVEQKKSGKTIGIDIGQKTVISTSNGFMSKKNKHGHDLSTITEIMNRKKKGSKGFERAQDHRKNYINWSINQLDLSGVGRVNREDIKDLRRGRRTSKGLNHWTYTLIFDKLDRYCEDQGVLVTRLSPSYTSQRCSVCGWVKKANRKTQKQFICTSCGFREDADKNASVNLSLDLPKVSLGLNNNEGFYWRSGTGVYSPC